MNTTPDGQFQTYLVEDGAYIRNNFFSDPRLQKMVSGMTDDEIKVLSRGGHDYRKVYAAFKAATEHVGQPTVILAQTVKGWTIDALEGKNATHQMKKLTTKDLKAFEIASTSRFPTVPWGTPTTRRTTIPARTRMRSSTSRTGVGSCGATSLSVGYDRPSSSCRAMRSTHR
jgi:hypothetical protein